MASACEARQPLWQRFPAAQQRLSAALLAASFPRRLDAEVWIEPSADGWLVTVSFPAPERAFSETFTPAELRAFRGRWDDWCSVVAAQAT